MIEAARRGRSVLLNPTGLPEAAGMRLVDCACGGSTALAKERGARVANAGYVEAESRRRQGVGSRLYRYSLETARWMGYRAKQFNQVVSTNTARNRCWQKSGFRDWMEAFQAQQQCPCSLVVAAGLSISEGPDVFQIDI